MIPVSVTHLCPSSGSSIMPCCGHTPFEAAGLDKTTLDHSLVTCNVLDWRSNIPELERFMKTLARTIAIDFDGVLHPYTAGWIGSVPADEPPIDGGGGILVHPQGPRVRPHRVLTTRRSSPRGGRHHPMAQSTRPPPVHQKVTHTKPAAIAYVDDRAVPFLGNWGDVFDGIGRLTSSRAHGTGNTPAEAAPSLEDATPNLPGTRPVLTGAAIPTDYQELCGAAIERLLVSGWEHAALVIKAMQRAMDREYA